MSSSHDGNLQDTGSSSTIEKGSAPATPQQQHQQAADAIHQLSLSGSAAAESPVEKFDPRPIKMSRGHTNSLDSFDGLCCDDDNNDAIMNHSAGNQHERGASQPQAPPSAPEPCATPTKGSVQRNGCHNSNRHDNHRHFSNNNLNSHIGNYNKSSNDSKKIGSSSHSSGSRSSQNSDENSSSNNNGGKNILLAPITGAWGWIQKQNEKQKKKHLRELAEEQVQRLQEAQKNDPNNHSINLTVTAAGVGVTGDDCDKVFRTPPRNSRRGEESLHDSASFREDEDDISWIPAVRVVEEQVKKDYTPSPRSSRNNNAMGDTLSSPDPTKPIPWVLSQEQRNDIARYVLPKGIAFCRWTRLYSLTRDGDSFWQCLRLCGSEPKTLLVIKTTRGAIFGGYADAPWELRSAHSHGTFHGSAQACLFSFSIADNDDDNDNDNAANQTHSPKQSTPAPSTNLKVFHWTGANRYIQYTDTTESKRMLAFGGGGDTSSFGLCVEQDFQFGSTGPCDTFGNLPLCDQENFNIMDMEIWGFLTGQF